jgi:hypothetical protein
MALLLDSLEIRGFRALRHVAITRLGRVNLVVGRNGSGKSSLLEAVQIYTAGGRPTVLYQLLENRSEFTGGIEGRALAIEHLFYGRPRLSSAVPPIHIGSVDSTTAINVRFRWYEESEDEFGRENYEFFDEGDPATSAAQAGLFVYQGKRLESVIPLDEELRPSRKLFHLKSAGEPPCIALSPTGRTNEALGALWDAVALTDLEAEVLAALRIVASDVERVALVGSSERTPVVRVADHPNPIPLASMGAGAERLLHLILALVNARDGVLLLDEVENGIHYSVQPDLWALIFQVAQRLNIQVFATSHSLDCVSAFQRAAEQHPEEGVLIRLQERKGEVEAVLFDEDKLGLATREQIEVRG